MGIQTEAYSEAPEILPKYKELYEINPDFLGLFAKSFYDTLNETAVIPMARPRKYKIYSIVKGGGKMTESGKKDKVRVEVKKDMPEKPQFHQNIELFYVLYGEMSVETNERKTKMKKEDILVINVNKTYLLRSSKDVIYVKISIPYNVISSTMKSLSVLFVCDSTNDQSEVYNELRKLIQSMLKSNLTNKGEAAEFLHKSYIYSIIYCLCEHFCISTVQNAKTGKDEQYSNRLDQINQYIQANYASSISTKEIAEKLFLSTGYLSRFFKKNYGMSFAKYLSKVRFYHAMDDLLYTDESITRIAYDHGFSSIAVFDRICKEEYGETPSEVRKKYGKNISSTEKVIISENIEELEKYLWSKELLDENYNLGQVSAEADVSSWHPFMPIWNKVINIGAASSMLSSKTQEHVMLLKASMGFHYVRFWNLFTKDMLVDIDNIEKGFNFSRIDSVFDFILAEGLEPFIELDNKPNSVERTADKTVYFEPAEEITSLNVWEKVLRLFMRHICSRYGSEKVNCWIFELWLNDEYYKDSERVLEYSKRFDKTCRIIKQYAPDAQVGGCGLHGYLKTNRTKANYVRPLNGLLMQSEEKPDFISIYVYPYDTFIEEGNVKHRPSVELCYTKKAYDTFRADLKNTGLSNVPICISEWNLTFTDRNWINDTCFKGAYIVQNYLSFIGENDVTSMAYLTGSDRMSEFYDYSNDFMYGGNGILTKDGILKPAAFAFVFLNRLYQYLITKDRHYAVTTDGRGSYGILCHNCKKLNHNYYYSQENQLNRELLDSYFEDLDPLVIHMNMRSVEDGMYQMKSYRINENNGSAMSLWKEMHFENNLSRDDLKYFRRVCEPRLSIQSIKAEKGELKFDIELIANEITFVQITKRE